MTRLGILYPGFAAEDDYPRLAGRLEPPVQVDIAHIEVADDTNTIEDGRRVAEIGPLLAGTARLRARGPMDAAIWACTAGGFVLGLAGAREQAATIAEVSGAPATSTSLAFVAALRAMGLVRVAVGGTYPAEEGELFASFLSEAGVTVVELTSLGILGGSGGSELGPEEVLELARSSDRPDAAAVLLPDTAVRTVDLLERLEAAVGKPVLTANQVSIWDALRLAGRSRPQSGLGRLFRE